MLKHAKGNLLDLAEQGKFSVIVHGCNCFHAMGGGIAKEIAARYPEAKAADDETIKANLDKLGTFSHASINDKFMLINAYTQYATSNTTDVFEYTAFQLILEKLSRMFPKENFGLPYIGMGLAGGDSNIIITMIESFAETVTKTGGSVTLVEFA